MIGGFCWVLMMLNMMLVFDDFEDGAEFWCLCWVLMILNMMLVFDDMKMMRNRMLLLDFDNLEEYAGF